MFAPKTVDGVLNTLSDALGKLEAICEEQEIKANLLDASAAELRKKARLCMQESERANRVRMRIKELLA